MLDFAGVFDHEPYRLPLFDGNVRRRKSHVVGHVDVDSSADVGRLSRLTDGDLVVTAPV